MRKRTFELREAAPAADPMHVIFRDNWENSDPDMGFVHAMDIIHWDSAHGLCGERTVTVEAAREYWARLVADGYTRVEA